MMSTKETQKEMTNKIYKQAEVTNMWFDMMLNDDECTKFWIQQVYKLQGMGEMLEVLGFEVPQEIRKIYSL